MPGFGTWFGRIVTTHARNGSNVRTTQTHTQESPNMETAKWMGNKFVGGVGIVNNAFEYIFASAGFYGKLTAAKVSVRVASPCLKYS